MKAPYEVRIQQLDNEGALVAVGCKILAFSSLAIALEQIGLYFENPEKVIAEYARRYGWTSATPPAPPPPDFQLNEKR